MCYYCCIITVKTPVVAPYILYPLLGIYSSIRRIMDEGADFSELTSHAVSDM